MLDVGAVAGVAGDRRDLQVVDESVECFVDVAGCGFGDLLCAIGHEGDPTAFTEVRVAAPEEAQAGEPSLQRGARGRICTMSTRRSYP